MPVSSLFNLPDKPEMKVLSSTRGTEVPVIDYNGYIIWGATSMILSEFRDLMKKFNFALYYETRLTIPGFCMICIKWQRKIYLPMLLATSIF